MCYGVVKSDGDESDSKPFACAIPIDCLSLTFVSGLFTVCAMPNSVTFIVEVLSVSAPSCHTSSYRHWSPRVLDCRRIYIITVIKILIYLCIFNYYGWYGTETKTTSTMMSIGS